jgi:putative flippase GtrA
MRKPQMEMLRFLAVSVVGVILDIAVAYTLAAVFGLPLWLAAATGFLVAAGGNYLLHELWTFRREDSGLSGRRGINYLGVSVVVLLVRLAVVAALETVLGADWPLFILIAGAGVSFFANLALSKFLVFADPSSEKSQT